MVIVTWDDAGAFLDWLEGKARRRASLPSEAEWEYACRAGTTSRYSSGDRDEDGDNAGWHRGNAGDGTRAVGQKAANAWGFYDLAGNVHQWCRDWYGPYAGAAAVDPEETRSNLSDKPRRVLRGGSWLRDRRNLRSAARYRNDPKSRNADNGFRAWLALEETAVSAPVAPRVAESRPEPPAPRDPQPVSRPPAPVGDPFPDFPFREPRNRDSSGGFPFVGVFIVVLLLFIAVSWMKRLPKVDEARRPRIPPPSRSVERAVPTRSSDDGFWIPAGSVPPGTRVRCRYRRGDDWHDDEFVVDEIGHDYFHYTGDQPSSITAFGLGVAAGFAAGREVRPNEEDSSPPPAPPPNPPAPGFPGAYE